MATAWDAVLLIDEADVFLEERSLHEVCILFFSEGGICD